jgi:hypothetical protein
VPASEAHWIACLALHVPVLLLVFSTFLPESPRYLLSHGRVKEAEAVLERIAAWNQALLPPGTLVATVGLEADIHHHQEEEQQRLLHSHGVHAEPSEGRGFSPDLQERSPDSDSSSAKARRSKGLGTSSPEQQKQQRRHGRVSDDSHSQEQELAPWHPSEAKTSTPGVTDDMSSSSNTRREDANAKRDEDLDRSQMVGAQDGTGLHGEHAMLLLDEAERRLLLASEGES